MAQRYTQREVGRILGLDAGRLRYWERLRLVRPQALQRSLTIYALLDSESVTGAYRFDIHPGSTTQIEVTSEIYPRRDIEKVGIAPLTSMFLFGEDHAGRHFDDFRPEVHDSDGLMADTGRGEWLWRPLSNPHELRVSRLMDHNPHGFTMWFAGGGVKPGTMVGETDEMGLRGVGARYSMRDFHATILHLLGLDHEKLTFRHAGRDYRLTDVHGQVVKEILA